ncbi:hypothetical protein EII25_01750 [Erysipelotrichaceae bacterium OH741_COT-311]|nr:hypothetical protein EII25_01750 [Erysipelotrichaceae bacterium OH741_COT-311]
MNHQIQIELNKKPELKKYVFYKSFLVTTKPVDLNNTFPLYDNFSMTEIDSYYFYVHKEAKLNFYKNETLTLFILGHCYNPFTMQVQEEEILEYIAKESVKKPIQSLIDELTGVFVIGYIKNGELFYQVDPSGMQSACSGMVNNEFYLSSHFQLIGDLLNLKRSDYVEKLINYKWYYRVMGPYLPADLTAFNEIKRIVPNIEYHYNKITIQHKRFYPLQNIQGVKSKEEYANVIQQASDILKNNMQLIIQKWNKPRISLTGGIDSNTTFACANGLYDKIESFSYLSAHKETIDVEAAEKISKEFKVPHKLYTIKEKNEDYPNFDLIKAIIDHNNGYVAKGKDHEYRKRVALMQEFDGDVEVKSWVSETIRCYWYKHYGRKSMPKLSSKLYRNLYKIFIFNRPLALETDKVFKQYIQDFEYDKVPAMYPAADLHYNEVTWGSWGGLNISEMRIYSEITFVYNNRIFLDLLFRIPLLDRIEDKHHLAMKKVLNKQLYDMNIRVVNMHETKMRAFLLNVIFTINMLLPF